MGNILDKSEIADAKFALFYACQEGDVFRYKELMQQGIDPNMVDDITQNRPIHVAVDNGAVAILECMLNDPRIDPTVAGHGWFQPIEIAKIRNYQKILKLFEEHGVEYIDIPRLPHKIEHSKKDGSIPQFG